LKVKKGVIISTAKLKRKMQKKGPAPCQSSLYNL